MSGARLIASRHRQSNAVAAVAVFALALGPACVVGSDGDFDLSGTGDSTGFPPDAEPCVFPTACAGGNVALCCEAPQPPLSLVPNACPTAQAEYPNQVSCVSNQCVRPGCQNHSDCSDLIPNYVCVDMGAEGRCAPGCSGDATMCQEEHKLPSTFECETVFGSAICVQSP